MVAVLPRCRRHRARGLHAGMSPVSRAGGSAVLRSVRYEESEPEVRMSAEADRREGSYRFRNVSVARNLGELVPWADRPDRGRVDVKRPTHGASSMSASGRSRSARSRLSSSRTCSSQSRCFLGWRPATTGVAEVQVDEPGSAGPSRGQGRVDRRYRRQQLRSRGTRRSTASRRRDHRHRLSLELARELPPATVGLR